MTFGRLDLEWERDGWYSLVGGKTQESVFSGDFLAYAEEVIQLKRKKHGFHIESVPPFLADIFLGKRTKSSEEATPLWDLWNDLVGKPAILYEMEKREKEFASLFNLLEEYLLDHRGDPGGG